MKHEPLRYAHDEGHTDVCVSNDGTKFITCGSDGDIRIWSVIDSEDPVHKCIGEWALCVRQRNDNLYVATGSNDIQILTYPDGERNGVVDRFVAPINHIAIAKSTNHIALAGEDMEIKLINYTDCGDKETTVISGLLGPCLCVTICPKSRYLAASSGDGYLKIWDISTKNLLKEIQCFDKINSFTNAKLLCRCDFEPISGKYLAYPYKDSVILLNNNEWNQCAVLRNNQITANYSIVQFSPCGQYLVGTTIEGDFVLWDITTELVLATSKHEKSIAITGLMWNPIGNGQIIYTDKEGQLGIASDCIPFDRNDDIAIQSENVLAPDLVQNLDDDDDDDDDNVISVEKLKRQFLNDDDDDEPELKSVVSNVASSPRPRTPEIPLQSPFMPSSTPEHLNPRYLCWNDVGVIRCYGTSTDDDAEKSIEVEFHDTTFHNSLMLTNYHDYTMGSLSKSALVVANSSQINVIPLGNSSKEWQLKSDENDEIVAITASDNFISFATNNYLIRICSIYGTQCGICSLPGPIITMNSYRNCLLIAYHLGGIRKNDQTIGVKLIKINGFNLENIEIHSSLSPESTLLWLGFTDTATPALYDSAGILYLYPYSCNIWIPFCDTTKFRNSPSDGFFVTAISETTQTVIGIKCKGTIYPNLTPRPTVCELPLQVPFCEQSTEKTQLEMNLFIWSNLQINGVEKKVKEAGLKTFALACKNNFDSRALELIELLDNQQILKLAIKYAAKLDKKRMVEKLMNFKTLDNDNDPIEETIIKDKSINRRLNLTKSSQKNRIEQKENTITNNTQTTQDSILNQTEDSIIDDSLIVTQEKPAGNPFLKNLKKIDSNQNNPLSLTNTTAGLEFSNVKQNKNKQSDISEKRKQPESEVEKPKEKQRRLDKYMFNKHS